MSEREQLLKKIEELETEIRSLKRQLSVVRLCTLCGNVCV